MSNSNSGENGNINEKPAISQERILIGDDKQSIIMILSMALDLEGVTIAPEDQVSFPGVKDTADEMIHKVVEAQNQGKPYGLVIVDGLATSDANFNNPDVNKIHALRVVRAAAQNGVKQIVIYSSRAEFPRIIIDLQVQYPGVGIQFIQKPGDLDDIVDTFKGLKF